MLLEARGSKSTDECHLPPHHQPCALHIFFPQRLGVVFRSAAVRGLECIPRQPDILLIFGLKDSLPANTALHTSIIPPPRNLILERERIFLPVTAVLPQLKKYPIVRAQIPVMNTRGRLRREARASERRRIEVAVETSGVSRGRGLEVGG